MLTLTRTKYSPTSTLGELKGEGVDLYTLERPLPEHGGLAPFGIIAGLYNFTVEHFPHMGIDAPLLQNVPGRTGIFIHPGNFPKDSEGCILVGTSQGRDFVGQSRDAFAKLMGTLKKGVSYQLEIR